MYKSKTELNYTEKILHDWFHVMDLDKFIDSYKIKGEIDSETIRIENLHFEWIDFAQINVTPTFFINGYELPKSYNIEDLYGLVPALADYFIKVENTNYKQQLLNV